jgi:CRP-like cAMP-binding protein
MLAGMLGESTGACGFDSLALEARAELPTAWGQRYSFAFVRRGYLVRLRTEGAGHATAVDAVGPGCAFPVRAPSGLRHHGPAGYAVGRALVCLCDAEALEAGLTAGGRSAVDVHNLIVEGMQRVERLSDARGRSSAASRVAALLCTLADTLRPGGPRDDEIPAEFLQRDLAALLSIRHESVCRVLRGFEDAGMIRRDADGLRLLDRSALDAT